MGGPSIQSTAVKHSQPASPILTPKQHGPIFPPPYCTKYMARHHSWRWCHQCLIDSIGCCSQEIPWADEMNRLTLNSTIHEGRRLFRSTTLLRKRELEGLRKRVTLPPPPPKCLPSLPASCEARHHQRDQAASLMSPALRLGHAPVEECSPPSASPGPNAPSRPPSAEGSHCSRSNEHALTQASLFQSDPRPRWAA